jgi:hypothetical protein
MNATTAKTAYLIKGRDDYGRTIHWIETGCCRVGVIARLPKVAIERYGKDRSYLVNDYSKHGDAAVTYHRTLAAAKAALIAQAIAAGSISAETVIKSV